MVNPQINHARVLTNLPKRLNDVDILLFLEGEKVNWEHVRTLKEISSFNDDIISNWLNVSVKTFRLYKKPEQEINVNIKEHVLVLLALMQHGKNVFGTTVTFEEWLTNGNFHFDGKAPVNYLKTITGIRFVDDRLTAMEYGDNV
jgi:uncharacterized protein (DUF2384 family)